jgi:hypothetical protein
MRVNRLLGGNGGQLKAQFGSRVRRSGARQAMMWGLVAECVYQQNGSRLCDIDNRALAVDSASTFLRQAAQAEQDARQSDAISNEDVRELARMRDHMLDGLRTYVRDGELIAADFGLLVPAAVRVVLDANKPDHDGCAKH